MTDQHDFWKPAPYDFEAVVAGIDPAGLVQAHRWRAGEHGFLKCGGRTQWSDLERMHDVYDNRHFAEAGLPADRDVHDNRRKREAA